MIREGLGHNAPKRGLDMYLSSWFKLYLLDLAVDIYNRCIKHIYVTGFDGKH